MPTFDGMTDPQIIDADFDRTATHPHYELFDQRSLGVATFFGTSLAAGGLMYFNAQQLGREGGAKHLGVGLAILLLVFGIGSVLPPAVPTVIYFLIQYGLMVVYYGKTQGPVVEAHVERGGGLKSRWLAFGIGIAGSVLIFGGLFVLFYALADDSGELPF